MLSSRREFLNSAVATAALGATIGGGFSSAADPPRKRHLVSLSFDDGFKKSFVRTAEIFEKFKLSACLNVVATGIPDDPYIRKHPLGDFGLWNELKHRGHEIMPHGHRHENLQEVSFERGKELVRRCLEIFREKLDGFDVKRAIFNFPFSASTPELERWLPDQVRAFRTGFKGRNPLPHKGQTKLTCASFGPGNCEEALDREIKDLLAGESGWMIFNTHGLDDEGWGPMRATYLDRLLERLIAIDTVDIVPVGRALAKVTP